MAEMAALTAKRPTKYNLRGKHQIAVPRINTNRIFITNILLGSPIHDNDFQRGPTKNK